jgi:predicted aminopeptidase
VLPAACAGALSACASLSYYRQSVAGHLCLMAAREPIEELIVAPATSPELRERLAQVLAIRDFATEHLSLPRNASYRSYVALDRPYAVWNVVATPELSLSPETWCFPVAGCVAYRGYYREEDAMRFADELEGRGYDVWVAGARAYSTLGWFDDPVLSTMLREPEHRLAGTIFHELAHQRIYVKDDSSFNEAFAVAVEREGLRRWLAAKGGSADAVGYRDEMRQDALFLEIVLGARAKLEALYGSNRAADAMRAEKARVLEELRADYRRHRGSLGPGYESWFGHDLNNAKLASIATYHARVPAFERLLAEADGDLELFYERVASLARLPRAERDRKLDGLAAPR